MMRLDKFLTACEVGSRSQVKTLVKKGLVTVNDMVCKDAEQKIDENTDKIAYMGKLLQYTQYQYYILHKPQGVVTATEDNHDKTVMDLLGEVRKKDLFPVGRLDKDTEGLLLITNDGALAHALLSPKKHVDKTYRVRCREVFRTEDAAQLEQGVDIGDDKPTLPAKVEVLGERELLLTIHEGRFHQVKRMLQAVGNEVVYLKRESFGSLTLDENLKLGEYRELSTEEIAALQKCQR